MFMEAMNDASMRIDDAVEGAKEHYNILEEGRRILLNLIDVSLYGNNSYTLAANRHEYFT